MMMISFQLYLCVYLLSFLRYDDLLAENLLFRRFYPPVHLTVVV